MVFDYIYEYFIIVKNKVSAGGLIETPINFS